MSRTISTTNYSESTNSQSHSQTKSQSQSKNQSVTKSVLDEALRDRILAGLMGYMSDEEINAYAENLLRPARDAQIEAAEHAYQTTKLAKEQEIESLASTLAKSIASQKAAYGEGVASLQNAALARGMGRSSYLLDAMKRRGSEMAKAIEALTADNAKEQKRIRAQITQAAQQNAQTRGRISTDYAGSLAAKVQELRSAQQASYNKDYLTAVSASMGKSTQGEGSTNGSSTTDETSTSKTKGSSTTVTTKY